jgi:hypothetical protein
MTPREREALLRSLAEATFDAAADVEPPDGFLEEVLRRTSLAPASRLAELWRGLMLRPRFAYEAAYVGVVTLCLVCASLGVTPVEAGTVRAGVAIQQICSEAGAFVTRATSYLKEETP